MSSVIATTTAQNFSGTYATQNDVGGTVTPVLSQEGAGQVSGTLSSGTSGYDGGDAQTQYDLTGIISGGGLEIEVHERHSSSMASATSLRLLPSQRGSASRFNGVLNNVLRVGGEEYRFQNVQVQTDQRTRGTATGQAGLTMLDGIVSRSGQPFGQMVIQAGQAFLQTSTFQLGLEAATRANLPRRHSALNTSTGFTCAIRLAGR